jgi:glycosyltransferase involved in cell wall biosynthesis
MSRFLLPVWIQSHSNCWRTAQELDDVALERLREKMQRFRPAQPLVSVIIPAYNEERLILRTLSSLADSSTSLPTEFIVANNRSTDRTQELLDRVGVRSVFVPTPGVAHARQAGLEAARGTYVLSADADCLYPPGWIDAMIASLRDPAVSCVYGPYSFLPEGTSRLALGLYEWMAERAQRNRQGNQVYANILGYNFGFRRADALAVGGFRLDAGHQGTIQANGVCEDGWMALMLQPRGRLAYVRAPQARVWSSPRRLRDDGSLWSAFWKRLRREVRRKLRKVPPSSAQFS